MPKINPEQFNNKLEIKTHSECRDTMEAILKKERDSNLEKELIKFKKRLIEMQVACPPEFSKIIEEHFWDLF